MHGPSNHDVALVGVVLGVIALILSVVAIGVDPSTTECTSSNGLCPKTPGVSLGVWNNMPAAQTELMGNTTYRGLVVPSTSGGTLTGLTAQLTVGCIQVSNTAGAKLQLQYALFNTLTNTITTGFQNVGLAVFIDGVTGSPCTNNGWATNSDGTLNTTATQIGYIFRVMGSGGGGAGDNPRFSFVNAQIKNSQALIITPEIVNTGTTTFTYRLFTVYPNLAFTVTTFWHATNITTTGCGISNPANPTLTDHCWEAGSSTCTFTVGSLFCGSTTVTFTTAFTGTVTVVLTTRIFAQALQVTPVGSVSLLQAQTLTV